MLISFRQFYGVHKSYNIIFLDTIEFQHGSSCIFIKNSQRNLARINFPIFLEDFLS